MRTKINALNKQSNSYQLINNFKTTNVKECTKLDKKNQQIYVELLQKANRAEKEIKNSILSVNLEVPPPPRPSNLERFNIWNKRNIKKSVIEQSEAVIFLYQRGYILNDDYEAYQAVDLSKEIKKQEGITDLPDDKTTQFDSIFTNTDNNIYRRRSIHKMGTIGTSNDSKFQTNKLFRCNSDSSLNQFVNNDSINHLQNNTQYKNNFYYNQNENQIQENIQSNNYQPKPSAPPISHNIVYPDMENNHTYFDYNCKKTEYEV